MNSNYTPLTLSTLTERRLVILGLGREGWSTYQFLRHHLPQQHLRLVDDKAVSELTTSWQKVISEDKLTEFVLSTELNFLAKKSLVFKTPGWPPYHPLTLKILQDQVVTTSNTQLFFDLLETGEAGLDKAHQTVIGITGTKGKSTTSALIHHLLASTGLPSHLGGNMGVPPLDSLSEVQSSPIAKTEHHYFVLELSCHQLSELQTSPDIAVIQNIVPEHLDYYPNFKAYVASKSQIARWQTAHDLVIFNPEFEQPARLASLGQARQLPFAVKVVNDQLMWQGKPFVSLQDLPLLGAHNLQNIMPAIVIGQELGLTKKVIVSALRSFKPLPHRLEKIAVIKGVLYVNDSLSTLPEATIAAVNAFPTQPITLIAGGYDRHLSFDQLAEVIVSRPIRTLVLFSPTGKLIAAAVEKSLSTLSELPKTQLYHVTSMVEAVTIAAATTSAGGVVLMSPASASFGEFKDYQDRGNQFRFLVEQLST